jgi:Helix-turn-helix domain
MDQAGDVMTARMRTKFALVPEWVYTRVTDGTALRIYIHLACKYCDADRYCFPSEALIAQELGYGVRTVERALKTLRATDALLVHRSRKTGGHWGRNAYTLPMDDPRDFASRMADGGDAPDQQKQGVTAGQDQPPNVAGGSEQEEQGVSAGQNQPPNMADGQPPNMAGREPDPLKQPNPGFEPDPSLPPRSTHRDVDTSPSTRGVDAAESTATSESDEDPNLTSSRPGVEPQTSQDEEEHRSTTDVPVETQHSADDLGGPPDPRFPNLTVEDIARIGELMAYLGSTDYEREERLLELVAGEVTWEYIGLEGAGYLDPAEQNAARDMLGRGEHWRKVVNTILKQRKVADAGFVGAG